MAKTKQKVLDQIGINAESSINDVLNKLEEYATVTDSELAGVKNISVKTLPTVVTNNETLVKERMYGVATNEDKGIVSLLNKRTVLINSLLNHLAERVGEIGSYTDLGTINQAPNLENNEILNGIVKEGIYTFDYENTQYLMLVSKTTANGWKQLIIYSSRNVSINYIVRMEFSDERWLAYEHATANVDYVNDEITKLTNFINTKFSNLMGGENINELYDTIKEIAEALASNKEVDEALNNALVNKVDKKNLEILTNKISELEMDNIIYQAQIEGGTYPRIMKYDDNTLYLFTDNAYSISKDGGKTWSERKLIYIESQDYDDRPTGENASMGIGDIANAFGIVSPNGDGRVIVFYRANDKKNNYYSIRCRVSDTNGVNFGKYQILHSNSTGLWEPFYYEGWLYYSMEHKTDEAQSIYRRKLSIVDDKVTCIKTPNGKDSVMALGGLAENSGNVNIDGVRTWTRIGMVTATPLKNGGHIYVFESSIDRNASIPRPMVVQYCYGETPQNEVIGTTNKTTLFIGDKGVTMGAPYVTTLKDGRIVISFQTDQYYQGVTPENNLRKKQVVVYVSKRKVNYGDELTADDFVRVNNYSYGENDYSVWGSVQNIDGRLYNTFTLGKNKNETERLFVTNIVKPLNTEITSNGGGVSEEEVLEIIEQNSEEVEDVRIATSNNYDVESDNEIPTSKAVAEMCKKAKLVATGKPIYNTDSAYNEQYLTGEFQLDNSLQQDKVYYVKRFDYNYWGFHSAILETYILNGGFESSFAPMTMMENMNDFILTGCCKITENGTKFHLSPPINYTFNPFPNYENMILIDEEDYVEIYELPITLGGNE